MNDPRWAAIHATPEFRALCARKSRFLWGLMTIAIGYYFCLPIGAAWASAWYRIEVWGAINLGLVFALSQFVVAWAIAWFYARRAQEFDSAAAAIAARAELASDFTSRA